MLVKLQPDFLGFFSTEIFSKSLTGQKAEEFSAFPGNFSDSPFSYAKGTFSKSSVSDLFSFEKHCESSVKDSF